MKKSKMAKKTSSVKKTSKNKKPLLNKAKKLLVKMSNKAKKPQVKLAAKTPAKSTVVKATLKSTKSKSLPLKAPKSLPMPKQFAKTAKPNTPEPKAKKSFVKTPPVKEIKKAPVVAAVLTKPLTKPAKPVKGAAKAAKPAVSSAHMCRELSCENVASTKGYCRLDYIKNWKKIKRKEMILKEGKLNQYIEELVGKYPDKYIDVIRQDLSTEVNFTKVIHDLELDESIDDLDYDGDSIDALIGGIKKEIEDFGDEEF